MKKFNTGVYQIVNLVNGKRYIGRSINLKDRKRNHFKTLKNNNHQNNYLQNSYNKYGKNNFKFEILLYCSRKNIIFYEQRAMDAYDFDELYNIHRFADGPLGMKHTEETKKKMSKAQKGRIISEETRKKMSEFKRGKPGRLHTEESKKKMSEIKKGKKQSKETREKISKANRGENNPNYGKIPSIETRKKMSKSQKNRNHGRPINVFSYKTGEYIGFFESLRSCAKKLNLGETNISNTLSKKQKQTSGYTFEYIKKENPYENTTY